MGALIVFFAILGLLALVGYLKFPPAYAQKRALHVYDATVVGVCAFLCLVWILHVRGILAGTDSDIWWTSLAAVGAVGIEIVFLGACFLMRNFWIFKPPSRPGSGFFR